ncbi:MAG: Plug domain-containing protein, partial [Kangiellaceae bacterium]|nr:Plug domain-containing protein [Kangiellaceae bacterium]
MPPVDHHRITNQLAYVWTVLLSLITMNVSAAEAEKDLYSMSLKELLTIKVFTSTKGQLDQSEAPSIVSTFSRQDIESFNAETLIDIIKHAPSIETSMGTNGDWRLSIRGERKAGNILLLLNSHPVNNAYDGHA